jgi:predicted Zn-dependent protease
MLTFLGENNVKSYFFDIASYAQKCLKGNEVFTTYLSGEASDFCRMNHGKVRQAGHVTQNTLSFRLIAGAKNARGLVTLSGQKAVDQDRVGKLVGDLRGQLAQLPDDPYLLFATDVRSTDRVQENCLPDAREVTAKIAASVQGLDMVGIYAAGTVYRGFANSLGQRNWYETSSFNLDWSFYLKADKAVKAGYAGFQWNDQDFSRKVDAARRELSVLEREPHTIKPGRYNVYLSPDALTEVTDLLGWSGAFGLKAHKTKQTPLLKMVEGETRLNSLVSFTENTAEGISPDFNESGFLRPASIKLVEQGAYRDCLISPRSAREYGVVTNGAGDGEAPLSLDLAAGTLAMERAAETLGEGIYINNLWYLNFSDRPACRVTGMTRFASFWVEGGKITRPLNVMRFDESLLKLFGDQLVDFTVEREMMLSASTYGQRSTSSVRLPGALVRDFQFTL